MEKDINGKICKRCGIWHPLDDFYSYHKPLEQKMYYRSNCKDCESIRRNELRYEVIKPPKVREVEKKTKKKAQTIGDIQREAAEHGMSYGNWVAYQYTLKERELKEQQKRLGE